MLMDNIMKFVTWSYSVLILAGSAVKLSVGGVLIAMFIAVCLVAVDFVTGVFASKREGRAIKIRSKRMRWSLAKILVYSGCLLLTILVGLGLHAMEIILSNGINKVETNVLIFTLYCVRVEAYFICWIESVSIIENLRRRFPDNMLLKFLHYIIAVEFIKKIPKLENFLKESDIKPYEYDKINKTEDKQNNNTPCDFK